MGLFSTSGVNTEIKSAHDVLVLFLRTLNMNSSNTMLMLMKEEENQRGGKIIDSKNSARKEYAQN